MCLSCVNPKYDHIKPCDRCNRKFCRKNKRMHYPRKYHYKPKCNDRKCSPHDGCVPKPDCERLPVYVPHTYPKCVPKECPQPEKKCGPCGPGNKQDLCCVVKPITRERCHVLERFTPKDITYIDECGRPTKPNYSLVGLIGSSNAKYSCTVSKCIEDESVKRGKKFRVSDNRFNVSLCEENEKCVDVVMKFRTQHVDCDYICGSVKFSLCSTQSCGKKVTITGVGSSKVAVESPKRDNKKGICYTMTWNNVPVGGDCSVLSLRREALDCKELLCDAEYESGICITDICVYE